MRFALLKWILLILSVALPLTAAERLTLYVGESRVLSVKQPKRVVLGNPAIAESRLLSDNELLVNAKEVGQTSLVIWGAGDERQSYEIDVAASGLKKEMIEVDVQILELSDAKGWDAGLDWPSLMDGQMGAPGQALGAQVLEQAVPPLLAFGTFSRGALDLRIKAMVQENKAKMLAKPKLLTVSGGSAKFLSGGQIPVVHQDSQGRTNTEYKDYGVALSIQPKADEEDNIHATLRCEVSSLDHSQSITLGGGVAPALRSRWVETTIYVKKNGTIVIAGLIQEEDAHVTKGIPLLSSIPVLGALFKLHQIIKKRSELVIFVTPRVL